MLFLLFILISFYIFLIIINYKIFIDNKKALILTIVTAALSTFMLFSSNMADLNWSITKLDLSGYRNIYEKCDVLEHPDFKMYYIFYGSMYLGQSLGLSYRMWWTIMSILAMSVIFIACKIHKYSYNLFLATFMAYYEMIFYSGFKFFYGFCFLLLAYGFLLRNTRIGQLTFVLFTIVASGFHVMYYLFLLFLIKPLRRPKLIVIIVVILSGMLVFLSRVNGSALIFLGPLLAESNNDHLANINNIAIVNYGFYLVLIYHLFVVYIAYNIKIYSEQKRRGSASVDAFYYTVLISLIFCPLYTIMLVFMRYITAFSFVVITAGSSLLNNNRKSRQYCLKMSIYLVISSYILRFMMGISGWFKAYVVPYFDVF